MSAATRDPWLARWLPLIGERAAGLPILELGCGGGRDSGVLVAAGHTVVGVDLSARAIANARQRVPTAAFHCQDIRAPFPVDRAGVVIASLSLHYFPWLETEALVERIRQFAQGWRTLSLEERVDCYDHPKWVWEAVLERTSTAF